MTTTESSPDADLARRQHVHAMWAAVADRWAEHADYADERIAAVSARLLDRVALRRGEDVLELACGPGGLGLAAAEQVGPTGRVVVSDVVAEMTAIAAGRAAERGLANVRAAVLDMEEIAEPDESYDVVLCREGLMFAVDPERAGRELHRVLRPGGRAAVSVWGPRAENPWLGLVFDAVTAETGMPVPPPGMPGPFALGDADRLGHVLGAAGLAGVCVEDVAVPLREASFEAWWTRTASVAGPLATMLASMPATVKDALTDRLRRSVEPYRTATGLELSGLVLVASAYKPSPR
jgi:ubiquinone/menaquinone biosynthesis C-methylase UbiE